MNVIKIEPGCAPQLASVEEITVRALSEALGGGIEVWNMDPCGRFMAVCRANGAEQGLPVNCRIPYLGCVLYGTVCVLRRDYNQLGVGVQESDLSRIEGLYQPLKEEMSA